MSVDELLANINKNRKKIYTSDQVLSGKVELNCLKRIDKIFSKGLHYYFDSKPPINSADASIFFRKSDIGSDLNFEAIRIVNKYEELKISLSALSKLADIDTSRILPLYSVSDNPQSVANTIRGILYPQFNSNKREFLKSLISKLADNNILVFEFIETPNKKIKANLDGFYLNPNVIVLKRYKAFRREIFTLVHELGHYLLDAEEIERLETTAIASRNLSLIERWCNDFAYFFLAGEYNTQINSFVQLSELNDFYSDTIQDISKATHLSRIAIYTRLLYLNKISQYNYDLIKAEFDEKYRKKKEAEQKQKELNKINGIENRASAPKAIASPQFISTLQVAFYEGLINEHEFCKTLNIKPRQFITYIQ